MTSVVLFSWLAACLPLIGALAGRMLWEDVPQLKKSCVIWCLITVVPILKLQTSLPEGTLLLALLPIVAMISILGQPVQKDHRPSWLMTLVNLGLGIGIIAHPAPLSHLFLLALLMTMIGLLMRHHTILWPISWWGISLFCFAALGVLVATLTDPPLSSFGALVTAVILIPLLPFHTGYVTALTRLPGNLPSFSAFLLPAVGLHVMASAVQAMPTTVAGLVSLLALIGALYGAVKALAQTRIRLMLSYASLSFFSMLWWHTAASGLATSRAAVFVASIGLATCGLLISWQIIRTRYGDDVDPSSISGLASSMPRYAVLLSLLALAAMGLPPFGVFAGLMGLLLHSPIPSLIGLMIMLSAWLAASWYLMSAVQRLLFGTRRSDLRYRDLVQQEWAALTITVVVLTVLGLTPIEWWTSTTTHSMAGTFLREIP
ncbi:MAG TPA: proton-conducting transporter membrane subunit [Nitrospira sp.]|nr:proton-conducting transporter membrane subunit [Nitrospira sp.]